VCTQEHLLADGDQFAQVGVEAGALAGVRKVCSCRWGEQAATTTRVRPSSWMSFSINSWPRLEHMNL
jgi:hypothetical protein